MGPIGIFDSGVGGFTVFKEIEKRLPQYDYIYLGDSARVPYGNRSAHTVYQYTKECVDELFYRGCHLIILACNTASAKALRMIQQQDLPHYKDLRKVLGVIRPTAEKAGGYTQTGHIGIFATSGTVQSNTYVDEINSFFPKIHVYQQACPMWVPLIENGDLESPAMSYYTEIYTRQLLEQSPDIDTIVLGCTHYPLLSTLIRKLLPEHIKLISQGELVAESLEDYLKRHPEVDVLCSKNGQREFLTTDDEQEFEEQGRLFYGKEIQARQIQEL